MNKKLVVTELQPEGKWLLNLDKFNDKTDIEVTKEIATEIMELQQRLDELNEVEDKLLALYGAGVDNWEGYDDTMEMFE